MYGGDLRIKIRYSPYTFCDSLHTTKKAGFLLPLCIQYTRRHLGGIVAFVNTTLSKDYSHSGYDQGHNMDSYDNGSDSSLQNKT